MRFSNLGAEVAVNILEGGLEAPGEGAGEMPPAGLGVRGPDAGHHVGHHKGPHKG